MLMLGRNFFRLIIHSQKEKKTGEKEKKKMMFLVATNVVASRPPERRPTGTPHAYAIFCTHEILSVMEGEMGVNIPELFGQPEMSEDDPARLSVR